jgi:hypothetical protein
MWGCLQSGSNLTMGEWGVLRIGAETTVTCVLLKSGHCKASSLSCAHANFNSHNQDDSFLSFFLFFFFPLLASYLSGEGIPNARSLKIIVAQPDSNNFPRASSFILNFSN